jgi:hypothetical protein
LHLVAGFLPSVFFSFAPVGGAPHSAARRGLVRGFLRAMDELGGGVGGGGVGTGLRRGFPVLEAPAAPKPEHVQGA